MFGRKSYSVTYLYLHRMISDNSSALIYARVLHGHCVYVIIVVRSFLAIYIPSFRTRTRSVDSLSSQWTTKNILITLSTVTSLSLKRNAPCRLRFLDLSLFLHRSWIQRIVFLIINFSIFHLKLRGNGVRSFFRNSKF